MLVTYKYHVLVETTSIMYEVLVKDRLTRLFLDLEYVGVGSIVKKVVGLLQEYTYESELFSIYICLPSFRSTVENQSYRLIFPPVVFRNIDDMEIFVLGFVKWLNERKHGAGLSYVKTFKNGTTKRYTVIDTAVYSNDRIITIYRDSTLGELKTSLSLEPRYSYIQPSFLSADRGDFCAPHIEEIVYKRRQEDYSRLKTEKKTSKALEEDK